ncbi:MAG: tRNA threonylcarbamoyladenosine dehydratase [Bacteroidales bacterium]|nr:tRNA threonylcarbamoyladenosine dehydratase [Bacteroidales bacterium]
MSWLERTEILLGKDKLDKLKNSHVFIAGLGGVGAYAAEQIVRAGVGALTIVDGDKVQPTNRNRQLIALTSNEGHRKVDVVAKRLLDINPDLKLTVYDEFIKDQRIPEILGFNYDYVVDAIDTLAPKVFLIINALKYNLPLISSMGAGGKLDPSLIRVDDISKSYNCNLARMVRKRLSKFGIKKGFKVVFSPEEVSKDMIIFVDDEQNKKTTVGTISYLPAMFGIYLGAEVIRDIIR